MPLEISCSFATSLDTPEHIAIAERLGYRRAWCYDSPAVWTDVWVTLGRAAERTDRIGLGPGVLIGNSWGNPGLQAGEAPGHRSPHER